MTDANNTANDAIQIDEDILTYTVSDEALAAGTERGPTGLPPAVTTQMLPAADPPLTYYLPTRGCVSERRTSHDRCEAASVGGFLFL
jgi:hypothetical protein